MMNNIKLSFCIPTYNRAEIVYGLIKSILMCNDPDIQVVVLDNGSTDNTLTILRSIADDRLVVYNNSENKGGLYNAVNVVNKAVGEYVVYVNDKDHIDFNEINKFKLFLFKHAGLACGFCEFSSEPSIGNKVFSKGYQSLKNIGYKCRHPSGYFFNNALLKSIRHVERFSDYNFVDVFPFEFILAELCLMGNGAIYHGHIIGLETEEMAAKHKSYNASGKTKEAFFSPEARLKLALNFTRHICTLRLTEREMEMQVIDVFFQQLFAATVGYRSILKNKNLCAHYNMECRDLKLKELISIGLNFYKQFIDKSIDIVMGDFIKKSKFKLHLLQQILKLSFDWIGRKFS